MNRRATLIAIAVASVSLGTGCMVPTYLLPAGFSGSYQRQLYGMEPGPNELEPLTPEIIESRRKIFYPQTASFAPATTETADAVPFEPMRLSDGVKPKQANKR